MKTDPSKFKNVLPLTTIKKEEIYSFTREADVSCGSFLFSLLPEEQPQSSDESTSDDPAKPKPTPGEPEVLCRNLQNFVECLMESGSKIRTGVRQEIEDDQPPDEKKTTPEDELINRPPVVPMYKIGSALLVYRLRDFETFQIIGRAPKDEKSGWNIDLPLFSICLQTNERFIKLVVPVDLSYLPPPVGSPVSCLFLPADLHLRVWTWFRLALLHTFSLKKSAVLDDYKLDHELSLRVIGGFRRMAANPGNCLRLAPMMNESVEVEKWPLDLHKVIDRR
ncbi:MAG: hypothetical protein GX444_08195 [Myxococcales bacterium]|nr:hypothetical protein [Myxococcales bacterium]